MPFPGVLENKYLRWYETLIERACLREIAVGERHHIVPKCLGGGNEKSNIVKLTYREHFLAHWLLTKFTEGVARKRMCNALHLMVKVPGQYKRIVSSWQYGVAREAARVASLGNHYGRGWRPSLDQRLEISKRLLGNKHTLGKTLSPEHKEAISKALLGKPQPKLRGRKLSLEHRAFLSVRHKGKPKSPEHRAKLAAHLRKLAQEGRNGVEGTIARNKEYRWSKGKRQTPEPVAKRIAAFKTTMLARKNADAVS